MPNPQFRLLVRAEQAAFLVLPWGLPLEDWPEEHFVEVERGIGRHVVRFVELSGALYALKELPPRLAAARVPAAHGARGRRRAGGRGGGRRLRPRRRGGEELEAVLITRYLEFSLPYRVILGRRVLPATEPAIERARRAARSPPPRRALLGRLLALERALPPRRGHALRVPRRCGDRRAARAALRRPAAARPRDRGGEHRRRAARSRGRARARGGRGSVRVRRDRARVVRAALGRADRGRGVRVQEERTAWRSGCAG